MSTDMVGLDEGVMIEGLPTQALTLPVDGSIDVQVATAHRYGRNISSALKNAKALACLNQEVAEACYYALPRGGKLILGPSIRLAEIMAQCWGHLRIQTEIVDVTDTHVVAKALAWDLLANVAFSTEARRRITDKNGNRYNEDMLIVAQQAALSVATRNAVFSVVPHAVTQIVYQEAMKTASGQAVPLTVRREKAMSWFRKQGVTEEDVCRVLGVAGVDDILSEDVEKLKGLATSIIEGTTTLEVVFTASEPAPTSPVNVGPSEAPSAGEPLLAPDDGEAPPPRGSRRRN